MAYRLTGQAEDYAAMTLDELETSKRELEAIRDEAKQLLADMQPFLDEAYRKQQEGEAAKADPRLTQVMGWPIPPDVAAQFASEPQTEEEREYTLKLLGQVMGWGKGEDDNG